MKGQLPQIAQYYHKYRDILPVGLFGYFKINFRDLENSKNNLTKQNKNNA